MPVANFAGRVGFADLCNQRAYMAAIEVGTDRGVFAASFLNRWRGNLLLCIDPYEPYENMPWDRTPDMMMAAQNLAPYGGRVKIIRASSSDFDSDSELVWIMRPQFIYIDGDHEYESVANDLRIWWHKLCRGGVLAGHDYVPSADGVVRAVDEFAASVGREVYIVRGEDGDPDSWYVEK